MIVCYLINRCSSIALGMKTPQELWTHKPPNLNHLRIFSCVAHAYINQGKLNPRAVKFIFLGNPKGVKWYRLWTWESSHIICLISHDVVFIEPKMPFAKDDKGKSKESLDNSFTNRAEIELRVEQGSKP